MESIPKIVNEIKDLKSKYGSTYFEKNGLYAVLGDLANNLDKSFISVLKKADEISLPEKITQLRKEEESIRDIQISNLRQDFVENTGLEKNMANLVFDVYLFGVGLKQDIDASDYKSSKTSINFQINEFIELAVADKRLSKNEILNIFEKGKVLGCSEEDIFNLLVQAIQNHNLKPLSFSDKIQSISKEIIVKYDWVDEFTINDEKQKAKNINTEKEKRLQLALQKEQAHAIQKEKELEIKRIELELKRKELEAKDKESERKISLERQKEIVFKKQQRKARRREIWEWLTKKDSRKMTPITWFLKAVVITALSIWIFEGNSENELKQRDAQEFSIELEKKYVNIERLIFSGKKDSAILLLPEILHTSEEISPFKPEGVFSDNYTFSEYWQMKRDELKNKIESMNPKNSIKKKSKAKSEKKNESKDKTEITPPKVEAWEEMGISEQEYQDLLENGYIEN